MNACKRCARPYCEEHGNTQYCAVCLEPASALPSFNLYRGSLLVMLVGTALAVVLIMRPPGETGGASPVIAGRLSPTATASGGTPQPSVAAATPQATTTAGTPASGTPAAGETPGVAATPAFGTYVVQAGDSVAGIAQALLPPGDDITAFERAIINLNNLQGPDPVLQPGQTLLLPPKNPAR
ncbi:MAG: LysM peptidoglycan-binding domain-containing protein [Dehalococcoidia bacterium]|nr:LysM peptidoglycan-binding domain-containing protein [Dehalococcoidia bacterium]